MIEIDGISGGGQMLRTALTLSAVTGDNFRMGNIRGKRSNPGLKRQHLEAVKSAARLCDAKLEGAEMNSEELVFKPGKYRNESFTANIGTAGSVTLLMDTILPITTQFSSEFRFTAKGGTDVKWSPTFDYFRHVKLPLLERFGMEVEAERTKTGYYPKGGGEAEIRTESYSMDPIVLEERGELKRFEIYSRASEELESQGVADRQADEAARMLKNSHVSIDVEKNVSYENSDSPGSSLLVKAVYENSIAGFDALGERGKRSEEVAKEAVQDFKSFHSTDAAVDSHMADQLMVFMAIVGGRVKVPEVTNHVKTNLSVVERMFGEFSIERDGADRILESGRGSS